MDQVVRLFPQLGTFTIESPSPPWDSKQASEAWPYVSTDITAKQLAAFADQLTVS
jgi:hypothetical protein